MRQSVVQAAATGLDFALRLRRFGLIVLRRRSRREDSLERRYHALIM
jgi:hypothetical protein